MQIDRLLLRQLNRLKIKQNSSPNSQQWKDFLERVNNAYVEANQERYLLERSLELSSKELLDLNEKLENAQHIARLGYWIYNKANNKLIWSKEFCVLFDISAGNPTPNYQQFLELIHPEQRVITKDLIEQAFLHGKNFEYEVRIKNKKDYRWYALIGQVSVDAAADDQLTGIIMDITSRKQAEEQVTSLHQQLLMTARQAGMADVATSVLHNVGNVLNSANVSIGLLKEHLGKKYYENFFLVIKMIKDKSSSLADYFSVDPKGKLLPEYIASLAELLENNHRIMCVEINNLSVNLDHIIEIISMQQKLDGVSGYSEKVCIPEIIDLSLQMLGVSQWEEKLKIIKEYNEDIFIVVDKTKLLQILVNLVQNARDSVRANLSNTEKKIIIRLEKNLDKEVIIMIEDNGVGIVAENIKKIFSFGFTTKENGHGFGLHSSALAAKDIGATLVAASEGVGSGATFTLTLPLNQQSSKRKINESVA